MIVLTCAYPYELFCWGEQFKVWIPIKEGRAAMPGYAFIPPSRWPAMRRVCPEKFRVRVLAYDTADRPKTVDIEELKLLQTMLNESPRLPPRTGSVVQVIAGPFKGLIGLIVKIKGDDARVRIGTQYIQHPLSLLS